MARRQGPVRFTIGGGILPPLAFSSPLLLLRARIHSALGLLTAAAVPTKSYCAAGPFRLPAIEGGQTLINRSPNRAGSFFHAALFLSFPWLRQLPRTCAPSALLCVNWVCFRPWPCRGRGVDSSGGGREGGREIKDEFNAW